MEKFLYDEFNKLEGDFWWFAARRKIMLSFLEKYLEGQRRAKILDVGCGTGFNFSSFQKFGEVYGMESSDEALRYLEQKGLKNRVYAAALPNFDIPQKFDCITCLDVLEHIRDDEAALRVIAAHLKPGGHFFITVPAYQWLWSEHDEVAHHVRRYGRKELERKLSNAGFKIERLTYYNTFLFPPAVLFRFFRKLIPKQKRSDFSYRWGILEKFFYAIFSSEAPFLKFLSFPFGLSLLAVAKKNV